MALNVRLQRSHCSLDSETLWLKWWWWVQKSFSAPVVGPNREDILNTYHHLSLSGLQRKEKLSMQSCRTKFWHFVFNTIAVVSIVYMKMHPKTKEMQTVVGIKMTKYVFKFIVCSNKTVICSFKTYMYKKVQRLHTTIFSKIHLLGYVWCLSNETL